MGKIKFLFMSVLVALFSMTMVSCSSDDDEGKTTDAATVVAGNYAGTLTVIGYADEPARCYVTFTRLAKDAVCMDKLYCEEIGLDMNPVNLTVSDNGDGTYSLNSESSKAISGTYNRGQVTLSFQNKAGYTYFFTGTKN